ncbi:MAG: hypothetical protein R3Y50_10705 [Rikenellaceae bacterium]
MDDGSSNKNAKIINLLETKARLKQQVYTNTCNLFEDVKEILHEMSGEINDSLTNSRLTKVEYRDRGKFEAQIQVSTDMLIFTMHTNVFQFDAGHPIFQNEYIKENQNNSYCGVINIYNFLADSFKYNRLTDEGYLIGRIFINHENHIFLECGEQTKYSNENFGKNVVDREALTEIIVAAIEHSIEFDLLVPPYDKFQRVAVEQMSTRMENSQIKTGKRLGYLLDNEEK